jgi:hypothetical protein
MPTIKIKKKKKCDPYSHDKRFAVSCKTSKDRRYRADFAYLHSTREDAEQEALRLTELKDGRTHYVIEIVSVTSANTLKPAINADNLDFLVEGLGEGIS